MCAAPWMSWMRTGGATVLKLQTSLPAMLSGGSFVSWSVTFAAKTVTVHVSAGTKFVPGSSVKLVPAPLGVAVCAPLIVQEIEYHEPLTFTDSLKPIVMLLSTETFAAPE